jgi:glycogen synthase
MKILVITNLYPPQAIGGYERSMADYARLLQQRGHSVLVLTSDETSLTQNIDTFFNVEIKRCLKLLAGWNEQGSWEHPLDIVAQVMMHNRFIASSILQVFQPDVCLVGNLDSLGVELIEKVIVDGIPAAHFVMNSKPGYPVELAPKTKLYRYIACSNWVKTHLSKQGYPTQTTQVVYPGAAVEEFYQQNLPPRDRLRIAYASLVMPYKGADVLMEALSFLHASDIPFSATFAGGSLMPDFVEVLKDFVNQEGMQEKIKFTGALTRYDLKKLYTEHNVLVFPSRFPEPFGISQIEAMAAGLTLITSGTGGASEIITHGQEGYNFESENPLDLADALAYLPLHPSKWESAARLGQQQAISHFSHTKSVEKLEALLLELVSLSRL